jgi:uncharacterized protein (TIGR03435 family)
MKRALLATTLAIAESLALSQSPNPAKLEFEVASVRLAKPEPGKVLIVGLRGGPGTSDPTHVSIENYWMFLLIQEAYHIDTNRLVMSGPGDRYTVTANLPPGTTKEQYRVMLQNLLAERFKMQAHHETREMPIYEMTLAKNGPPLKQHSGGGVASVPDQLTLEQPRDKDGYPVPGPGEWAVQKVAENTTVHRFNLVELTLPEFATNLSSRIGRPIVDSTGISGKYDFVLSTFVDIPPAEPGAPVNNREIMAQQIAVAVQKQLGLRLEPKKGRVDVLVVDHYDKIPTEN